jgi:predicted ABC-type ATPase
MPTTDVASAIGNLTASLREPLLVVLAGSNGAGKTTFYERFLANLPMRFINADRIAAALSPGDPDAATVQATRLAETMRRDLVRRGESFVMETVFSDPAGAKLGLLRDAQAKGYAVVLLFIGIESPSLSAARVAQRLERGGHDVPDDRVISRFPRTLANLRAALAFVDVALRLDNSSSRDPYRPVATWRSGREVSRAADAPSWLGGSAPRP